MQLHPTAAAGPLSATHLCQAVAALQPANTILVDESLTSGGAYYDLSKARLYDSESALIYAFLLGLAYS